MVGDIAKLPDIFDLRACTIFRARMRASCGVGVSVYARGVLIRFFCVPTGWSRPMLSSRPRKVRAPLGALPDNAWARTIQVVRDGECLRTHAWRDSTSSAPDSATENTPPTIFGSGKGEKAR